MTSTRDLDSSGGSSCEAVLPPAVATYAPRAAEPAAPASAHAHAAHGQPSVLTPRLVLLLAAAAGLGVAPLYYSQPMLGVLGPDIGASARAVGFVPTLTQLGYALGILLLAPLGDRYDRRRVILVKAAVLVGALLLAALAPSIGFLLAASFAVGLAATLAQDVVPAGATLAPDAHRGKVVGTVMTGLLLGILLSRVVAGVLAGSLGWRATFVFAALSVAVIGVAAARGLPSFRPTTQLPYRELIVSLGHLWRRHPALRRAAFAQGILAIGFSAFWTTLAVMLHGAPFHLGSAAAGAFGLAGASGALAAPLAGRLADRRGAESVTRLGIGVATVSFAAMGLAPRMPVSGQLALIALCTVGFDLGFQSTLIAHQTIVYGIDPASRSRLNAVLFVGMFIGMSGGAALGTLLFAQWGWTAVVVMAVVTSLVALAVRWWRRA
ncbi:MFS transporter [Burkholderia plantarii]|uniref:MFS transporter n=1 Tax=Burkholderia plantarii TaxID=41899 RepID=UPI0007056CD5|nr:MFS transporter [Burkholderia plantarii]ALK32674.1 Major facilitator superfamily MFS_1 [Burkholderia plantarii]GLZ20052.1 MFS transporter [Burkholderia plantarii]